MPKKATLLLYLSHKLFFLLVFYVLESLDNNDVLDDDKKLSQNLKKYAMCVKKLFSGIAPPWG